MRKLLPIILLSLIPLSGCSSPEPELSYDPLELIEYENCLIAKKQFYYKFPDADERALALCEYKKPTLK